MKPQILHIKSTSRLSLPALDGMLTLGRTRSLRSQSSLQARPRLQIVPQPEKNPTLKAEDLFAYHNTARRRTEFWENLLFAAFGICSLAAIVLAFLARGH